MPFCSQCGNRVGETQPYCRNCGAAQPVDPSAVPPPPPRPPFTPPPVTPPPVTPPPVTPPPVTPPPYTPPPYTPPQPLTHDPLSSISPRTASILCYIPGMGWIAAIIVLAAQRFRQVPVVRFHAFQGLYLFVAWLMNDQVLKWALGPHLHVHDLVSVVLLIMSIFMMVKASHDEAYSLPLFGDLAHRSMSEN